VCSSDLSATATRSARPERGSTWPSAVTGTHTFISGISLFWIVGAFLALTADQPCAVDWKGEAERPL